MRVINNRLHEDIILPNRMHCPYCGGSMNTATSINTSYIQDGDYGLCVGCGEICITIVKHGVVNARKPTEEEIKEAKENGAYDMISEYQTLIRNGNSGLHVKKQTDEG